MKAFIATLAFVFTLGLESNSQSVISCSKLMEEVKQGGIRLGGYSPFDLLRSSWLYQVDGYKYADIIFVIALVKRDVSPFTEPDKYIFCGISKDDWDSFSYPLTDMRLSIGEKFQKYIYNYKCNCY